MKRVGDGAVSGPFRARESRVLASIVAAEKLVGEGTSGGGEPVWPDADGAEPARTERGVAGEQRIPVESSAGVAEGAVEPAEVRIPLGSVGEDAEGVILGAGLVARVRALDGLWIEGMGKLGFEVRRGEVDAWVASDGRGVIHVVGEAGLDADDTLAQILLHEGCHALVEGRGAWDKPDWGLSNEDDRHADREVLALRLQWALLREVGLERVLVPTTGFRALWEFWLGAGGEADVAARGVVEGVVAGEGAAVALVRGILHRTANATGVQRS